MAKPINQHWVPRFYLRQFATMESRDTDRPQVWILAREGNSDPQLTNVKNIAAQRYLYSPKTNAGERDWETEEKLGSLETLVGGIWDRLSHELVDFAGEENILRRIVALFIATLHLRHPSFIKKFKELHAQIVSEFDALPRDALGNPIISTILHEGVEMPFDNTGYTEYRNADSEAFKRMFAENIMDNAKWFAEQLIQKRWSVVFSEQPVFITTDTPVILAHKNLSRFGLNTPNAFVMFPICPTRILIIDDQLHEPQNQYYRLGTHGPAPFNFTLWRNCERFMISPRHTDLVCAEIVELETVTSPV